MEIRTQRLTLVPLCMAHLESTHDYASDPEITRYMVNLPNESLAETERFIRQSELEWLKPDSARYEFAVLREGAQVGGVTLFVLEENTAELGWILNKRHWGSGYALEAARAVMEWGRRELGFRRFIAQCDGANAASYRLMERLGMRRISCTGGRKNRSSDEERTELTYEVVID